MERAERELAERASGTPNLTYDLVALLHAKTESIAVYETYIRDAREAGHDGAAALFAHCREVDREIIGRIQALLADELGDGARADQTARTPMSRGGGLPPALDDSIVDEASKGSFPASDAPSFTGSAIG
jgi:hypothetical protein